MGTAMNRQSPQARAESKFSAYAVGGDGFVSRLNAELRFCYAGGWGSLCLWRDKFHLLRQTQESPAILR